ARTKMSAWRAGVMALCGLALLTCAGTPTSIPLPPEGTASLHLEPVAGGFDAPLYLASSPGDTARLFVLEQPGQIQIIQHGLLLQEPFLVLRHRSGFVRA